VRNQIYDHQGEQVEDDKETWNPYLNEKLEEQQG